MKPFAVPILLLALPLAGCLGSVEEPVSGASVVPNEAADAAATVETLAYEGTTATGACAWTVAVGTCKFPMSGEKAFMELKTDGQPARLEANLTWKASTPAAERLTALLLVKDGDVWSHEESYPYDEGRSPLPLDWDLAEFEGRSVALYVTSMEWESTPVAGGGAGIAQSFQVEGRLTVFEPAG